MTAQPCPDCGVLMVPMPDPEDFDAPHWFSCPGCGEEWSQNMIDLQYLLDDLAEGGNDHETED